MVTDLEVLETLTKEELQDELRKAEDSLDDVQEERRFTLGQTGFHLGAIELKTLLHRWERDETRLKERLEHIKSLLER